MEDLLLRGRYKAGDRVPPEAVLVEALGVSRVTVRTGWRGSWSGASWSGARAAARSSCVPPEGSRLQSGLERLETYTVHAARLGLELGSKDVTIEATEAAADEAAALEVTEGAPLVRVSRVLLIEGQPAAVDGGRRARGRRRRRGGRGAVSPRRDGPGSAGHGGRARRLQPDVHRGGYDRARRPHRERLGLASPSQRSP
jgi:hypothetical protein